jgi:hypothetical protein
MHKDNKIILDWTGLRWAEKSSENKTNGSSCLGCIA